MGCDIHAHIEIRYNGKWEHYAIPHIKRRYELFGIMAGVRRDDITPIVQPKGVPHNMSTVTRLYYEHMGPDAHTASWFNEEEIDLLIDWLEHKREKAEKEGNENHFLEFDLEYGILNKTYLFGNSLTAFKRYNDVEYVPKGVDAVRLIFWFDN